MKRVAFNISEASRRERASFVQGAVALLTTGIRLISPTIARSVDTEPRCGAVR